RYGLWLSRFVRGDFGDSFEFRRPATEIIGSRLGVTLTISICAFLISWGIGIPLGIYSATHQYSRTDNFLTTVTFIGLGIPDFLLGLLLLVTVWMLTGEVLTGMNSSSYASAPWSVGKVLDFLKHLWIPVTAVVITGTAWIMRVMRGNLLDQLGRPYVTALRARGLPERVVIYKHAVRNALHPLVMSLGQTLAWLISGFTIISLVLDLPTIQSIYLRAMLQQDVYLGGTILILIGVLILIGTLLADILLAWLDPRIRLY
ncbi:ABC transporter permease, partial [Caldilinea sp.]|uniref:ABC transporter permease n=1 Tax=Caldilinea sp. TaxID=2293560 RepID=UPI002B6953F7|nr:ABC transporter permease [Caldilinea sp.]